MTKDPDATITLAPQKFDEKTVPWNATLVSTSKPNGGTTHQLDVIVDLHKVSPLMAVKSMSVTVEFFVKAKSLGVATFEFPGTSGLLFGGKKVEHFFDIKDPRFNNPAVTMKPLHFDGTVDTEILADEWERGRIKPVV